MKHKLAAALFATSLLLATILAGCTKPPTLTGVILEGAGTNSSLYIYTTQGANHTGDVLYAALTADVEITDAQGQALALGDVQPGRLVEITYDGPVQESYPPTYTGVGKVQVLGTADAGLYDLALERQAEIEESLKPPA